MATSWYLVRINTIDDSVDFEAMYPWGAPIPRPQATCPSKTDGHLDICDDREVTISDHLKKSPIEHPGKKMVRTVVDTFEAFGPHGTHKCLLDRPLGMTFAELLDLLPEHRLPTNFFKVVSSYCFSFELFAPVRRG